MFAELNSSPNLTKNKSTRLHVKRTFKNLQEVLMNKTANANWTRQGLSFGPGLPGPGIKQILAGAVKKAAPGQGRPCCQMLMFAQQWPFVCESKWGNGSYSFEMCGKPLKILWGKGVQIFPSMISEPKNTTDTGWLINSYWETMSA